MTRLPFGKFRGHDVADVPGSYLSWLYFEAERLDPSLHRAIRTELAGRLGATLDREAPRLLPAPQVADAARAIVDTGYRVTAKRAHPDIGGDHRQMIAVSDARDYLRRAVEHGVVQ